MERIHFLSRFGDAPRPHEFATQRERERGIFTRRKKKKKKKKKDDDDDDGFEEEPVDKIVVFFFLKAFAIERGDQPKTYLFH